MAGIYEPRAKITLGDAQKKFSGPESLFWVTNNNLVKPLKSKIAKMANFRPFINLQPKKELNNGPEISNAHVWDPTQAFL